MSIYNKLLAVQQEIGAIKKDSKNPFFKSAYFDINKLVEVCKPILNKHGLVLLQPLRGNQLVTIIADAETGEVLENTCDLPHNDDPQKMGSIITYFRRYSLQSLLFLEAVDDDANLGAGNAPTKTFKTFPAQTVRATTAKAYGPRPIAGLEEGVKELKKTFEKVKEDGSPF